MHLINIFFKGSAFLDRDKLLCFYEVAKSKSVKLTAEKIGSNSPTISRTIKLIEEDIGQELFTSSPRRMTLTRAGEILFRHTQLLLLQYEGLQRELQDSSADIQGEYIITTGMALDSVVILQALKDFMENHSNISFSFMESPKIPDFTIRETDIDIRPLRNDKEIECCYLKTDVIKLYASEECLVKYGAISSLKDFTKHNILAFPSNENNEGEDNLNWHLPKYIDLQTKKTIIQSSTLMKEAIETGFGIGPLPEIEAQKSKVALISLLPTLLNHTVDTYFMYPKASKTKAITTIYKHLKKYFEKRDINQKGDHKNSALTL